MQDTHPNTPDAVWNLLNWFLDQEKVVGEKFAPYLRLRGQQQYAGRYT